MSISHKARNKRFIGGRGNVSVNGHRGWQLVCSKCDALSKVISSAGRHSMPPEVLIRKFAQAGWLVAPRDRNDVCPDCQRKQIKSHVGLAAKALTDLAAPMVKVEDQQVHFNAVKAAAATLAPEQAKQLIQALRERIPVKPVKHRQPRPEPQPDPNYQRWLDQLD